MTTTEPVSEDQTSTQSTPLHVFPVASPFTSPFDSATKTSFYNFFGSVSAFLADPSSALSFSHDNAVVNDAANLSSLLTGFVAATHEMSLGAATQKSHCHITMWTWKMQPGGFGTPAWHRDLALYPLKVETMPFARSKYCVTLLGQPTRFLVNTPLIIETATKAYDDDLRYDDMALCFEKAGFDQADRAAVETGQLVRFTWGQSDSPVHAEPLINRDRVFASVIYANEEEIRGLAEWRDEPFVGHEAS